VEEFLSKHNEDVIGTLSGFDRLVFRGTLRLLAHCPGMMSYLWAVRCCSRTLRRLPRPDPAIEGGVGGTCTANWAADPLSGVINARIQTWFPFSIEVCINGREWLARMMDGAG